jgi:hypothetical protein
MLQNPASTHSADNKSHHLRVLVCTLLVLQYLYETWLSWAMKAPSQYCQGRLSHASHHAHS